jgi:hypothetical protein
VRRLAVHALLIAAVLAGVAALTPEPLTDDRAVYLNLGRRLLMPGCASIHCFRLLLPAVIEPLPGPSLLKWKVYAVVANAAAALAVGRLCLVLGLSASAAVAATWIYGMGAGTLYTLFDSYTSDPLMFLLGPLVAIAVLQGKAGRAGVMSGAGVFAKEFALVPLWIFTGVAALERRWRDASKLLVPACAVTILWAALQASLRIGLHYNDGDTASANLLHGGYVLVWLRNLGVVHAMISLFTTFGALYLLLPIAVWHSRRNALWALASLPPAAALVYVQQPERALWNFHFVVIPLAVGVLEALPPWAIGCFVALFGAANLRFGAQLPLRGASLVLLPLSMLFAVAAIVRAISRKIDAPAQSSAGL